MDLFVFGIGMTVGIFLGALVTALMAIIREKQSHQRVLGAISEQLRTAAEQNLHVLEGGIVNSCG